MIWLVSACWRFAVNPFVNPWNILFEPVLIIKVSFIMEKGQCSSSSHKNDKQLLNNYRPVSLLSTLDICEGFWM